MEEKPNPTRMELLKIKARIKLARKGHKLLKQKRDALIMEFFKILGQARDLRGQLNQELEEGYRYLAMASFSHTIFDLDNMARMVRAEYGLDVKEKNVMGVKIPKIRVEMKEFKSYPIFMSSAKVDKSVEHFRNALKLVLQLAETETAIKRIIKEIEKTKRRVNALEFVVLPRLEEQEREIRMRLEEMERDMFVSLKVIKRRLEKEAEAAS